MALTTFEIDATEPLRGSVIWLHGLGASHHDFLPVIPELRAPYLRFVFPSAPMRALTLWHGTRIPAWYDISAFTGGAPVENQGHLRESSRAIEQLLEREHERGVAREHIVLAGFSQGGAMALHTGLRSERQLGGILVLSGYLPAAHSLSTEAHPARRDTPILFCHGRRDAVVPYAGGRLSHTMVTAAGFPAEWADFDVAHTMCIEEVRFIADWLAARFAPPTSTGP